MKNKIGFGLLLLSAVMVQGCMSQSYIDNKEESDQILKGMKEKLESREYDKVVALDLPPFSLKPIDSDHDPDWLNTRFDYSVNAVELGSVLKQILENENSIEPKQVIYGEEVDPKTLISLKVKNGTLREAFNLLTVESNYGFSFSQDTVNVEKYVHESFYITLPAGVYSSQMGSQGEESEEGATVKGQFINVSLDEQDLVQDISKGIEKILEDKVYDKETGEERKITSGSVSYITGMTEIDVKTTPARMVKVQRYVKSKLEQLSRQSILDFRVIEYRSLSGEERGADLNVVKDVGDGTLQFISQGTQLVTSSSDMLGFGFKGINGWEGTTAFIRALETVGQVSFERPIYQPALNNQPVRVTQQKIIPYVYTVKSNNNEGVVTSDVERRTESEGIDLSVVSNADDDSIWVRVTGSFRTIIDDRTETVQDTKLRFLTPNESKINFVGKLKFGHTYIISRVAQKQVAGDISENFGTHFIGTNTAKKEYVETMVLLTPRRFTE